METIVSMMKALGEENRFRMVMMLKMRPMCVCELCAVLNISISTVSTHLKQLANAGIVESEKDGRWVTYALRSDEWLADLIEALSARVQSDSIITTDQNRISGLNREYCAAALKNS